MMKRQITLPLGLVAILSMTAGAVRAGGIGIADASFETKVLVAPIPYTVNFAQLLPWIGQWAAIVRPDVYSALYGEGEITPEHGVNVAYFNNNSSDFRPYIYQTLNYNYLEGATYTLSMAAAEYKAGEGADGQLLTLRLGYWTGPPDPETGPVVLAERLIAHSELTVGTFADFSVTTGPVTGDAVGKRIVVYISRADGSAVGGRWYLDNVQLSSIPDTPPVPPIPPLSNPVADGAITVDGAVPEWTALGVTPFALDPNDSTAGLPDWAQLWMAHDSTYIYFRMDRWAGSLEFESPDAWGYIIELDTDQNATTGDAGYAAVGAEIATQNGTVTVRWQLGGRPCGYTGFATTYGLEPGSLSTEFALRRADLGDPSAIGVIGYGYPALEFYPDGGQTTDYFTYVVHPPGAPEPAVATSRSNQVASGTIAVDGIIGDWAGIPSYPVDPAGDGGTGQDWVKAAIAHDNDTVYFLIERTPESAAFDSAGYWIVLDTDNNKHTGLAGYGAQSFSIGGEYSITGSVNASAWAASGCLDHDLTGSLIVAISADGLSMEASVSRTDLGLLDPFSHFEVMFAGEVSGDHYPDGSHANNGGTTFLYEFTHCNAAFADADGDSDVDQADFGVWQACFAGAGFVMPPSVSLATGGTYQCICFDRDNNAAAGDGDIDELDLLKFLNCRGGPAVVPPPTCGQ